MNKSPFHTLLHHATLEQRLLELFPKELFEKLSLPLSTHPLILHGLPRNFDPYSQDYLLIKKGFEDLSILKERVIDKALLSIYKERSYEVKKEIVILTYVVPGGLGDYFAQRFVQKKLKKAFPLCDITTICFLHQSAPCNITDATILHRFFSQKELHPLSLPPSIIKALQKASLILQIPTPYPYLKELESLLKTPQIETIGEYGFIQSSDYLPTTQTRCLGLHFLEYGLLLDKIKETSLLDLSQKPLLSLLMQHHSLTEYRHKTHLYFSYLCTDYGYNIYLYGLLLYLKKDQKDIDILSPDIGFFLKILEKDHSFFLSCDIQKIEIYYKGMCSTISLKDEGKRLRIIHTGKVFHEDFIILLKASDEPVGIRGNLSFSEAISLNKSYFYDPLAHNLSLYYELLELAKDKAPAAYEFIKLYKQTPKVLEAAGSFADLISKTTALEQLKTLNILIQERFSATEHLENLTHRALYHETHPTIKKKERSLVALFTQGDLDFEFLISSLYKIFPQNPS